MKMKVGNTRRRVEAGSAHVPGHDYLGHAEMLTELGLLGDSLRANNGTLVADGV